jgi:hypothetical protein
MIEGLFAPLRFLDPVRDFLVFEDVCIDKPLRGHGDLHRERRHRPNDARSRSSGPAHARDFARFRPPPLFVSHQALVTHWDVLTNDSYRPRLFQDAILKCSPLQLNFCA